jgi:orotate phosphoribosyltransferase
MRAFQREFVELALELEALRFGTFTLKSGRVSPYFFNSSKFSNGYAAAKLSRYYSAAICNAEIDFDVVFGPAYKGIPLAALAAASLAEHHDIDVPYAYNRKEAKQHGEGGIIVGGPLEGDVVIVDDVITAGTAIRESVELIRNAGARVAAVVISLDRQERGQGDRSAVQEVESSLEVPVIAIATLEDLISHLEESTEESEHLEPILAYRNEYGVAG